MSEKQSTMLENLKKFLDSPEGKKSMERFAAELTTKQVHKDRWVERCIKLIEPLDSLDDLFNKYDKHSDKRRRILANQGIDGDSDLSDIILGAFEKLGREPVGSELPESLMFTAEIFIYKGIIAELCVGQGSFIAVYKAKTS